PIILVHLLSRNARDQLSRELSALSINIELFICLSIFLIIYTSIFTMNTQLLLAFAGFALLAQILVSFVQWLRSPLRSVPGPLLARYTDFWYFHRLKQGKFEKVNQELHEQYGPIVRYGPNRYSINDAEALKTVYGHGTQFQKSEWYIPFQPNEDQWNVFSDRSIQRHAHSRRFYTNAYSMTSLVNYEPYVDDCGALFSQRLSEFAKAGSTVDIGHWFQCFAFDAVAMMTYGKRLGFLDRGEDIAQVIDNINKSLVYSSLTGIFPSVHMYIAPLVTGITKRLGMGAKMMYVIDFTAQTIEEERASPKTVIEVKGAEDGAAVGETFLTKFLAKHSSNPTEFTNWHLLIGCASNVFAGSDTTGISISAIVYHLLKSPDALAKLREEIADFTSRGELSQAPSFKESQKMPYLQAVIKEALRVHPAVGLPLERIVPEGGATIGERFFPAGSVVGINSWVHHRNTAIFGDDAEKFNPDRWLIENEERISVMNRNWMPFGLGSRTCLGKNVSILEMSKLIPRLIRDFDFKLEGAAATPRGAWKTRNAWFVKPKNFHVKVKSRMAGN
ncbi:cytochrome P450 oxidoreductase, partial [Colletotrichum costaricense]